MSESTTMLTVIPGHLYDFPSYYELVFGSDWKAEFHFLKAAFAKFARGPVRRVFEPACGTGRLLVRLGQLGYQVSGNDLNAKAVDYCNARLVRRGLPATAEVGDMADFRLKRPVDAAFNLINSFRHLPSESTAAAHLECMARAIRPGGLYLLGLHLTPTRGKGDEEELWTARRGNLQVNSRLWTIRVDRRQRQEHIGMTFDVYTPLRAFQLRDQTIFRTYTAEQMDALLHRGRLWDVVELYDFHYLIDEPVRIDAETQDVIYVLRRR